MNCPACGVQLEKPRDGMDAVSIMQDHIQRCAPTQQAIDKIKKIVDEGNSVIVYLGENNEDSRNNRDA